MKTITRHEFNEWCNANGLDVEDREWPRYRDTSKFSFTIKLPQPPYKSIALARMCFAHNFLDPFPGAMVWYRDWGMWNQTDEVMGMHVIQSLRATQSEMRPLINTPGHLFSPDEFVEARAFWTFPILIGWDVFLFPAKADYFVFSSHDEFFSFSARTAGTYEALLQQFEDWEPARD